MPEVIKGLEEEKISTSWKLNLEFALIVMFSILW